MSVDVEKKSQNMDQPKNMEEKSLRKASPFTTSIEGRITEEIHSKIII